MDLQRKKRKAIEKQCTSELKIASLQTYSFCTCSSQTVRVCSNTLQMFSFFSVSFLFKRTISLNSFICISYNYLHSAFADTYFVLAFATSVLHFCVYNLERNIVDILCHTSQNFTTIRPKMTSRLLCKG